MQVIITERCKKCGTIRRVYNKKYTYYFGPKVSKCVNCEHLYYDHNATELSTCSKKYVKSECKDFMIEGQNFLCFVILMIVLYVATILTSEDFINQDYVILPLLLLGYGIPFIIKCVIKYFYFWKHIYKDSVERMNDSEYLELLKKYDEQDSDI